MNKSTNIKPLSDALSAPILSSYKAGGLGLAFLTLGALLMLIAFFWNDRGILTYFILGIGTLLIFSTLAYFYFKDMRKLVTAKEKVHKNKELIDAIQQTALELTELAYVLQSLIFKHAEQVSTSIQYIKPLIKDLPIIGQYAESQVMTNTELLSASIVETTENIKGVIEDLQKALTESDPKGLKKYLGQLQEYKLEVKKILGKAYIPSKTA